MIEMGIIVFLSISTITFVSLYLYQKRLNKLIIANTLKFLMTQEVNSEQNKTDKEKANEDFLKFVSDSRDWAYTYIEDVQASLNKFITDIDPEIIYFDEYGVVGSAYPHYYSMKKISEAYKELKKILPDDYGEEK
jgi:hypothetical protein